MIVTRGYGANQLIITRGYGLSAAIWYEIINLISAISRVVNLRSRM
jgi:hypothetical protein